jgi:hypothetical protein
MKWLHGNTTNSAKDTKEMAAAFGIAIFTTAPALQSNHIADYAVDMTITCFAGNQIKRSDGTRVIVNTTDDLLKAGKLIKYFINYLLINHIFM